MINDLITTNIATNYKLLPCHSSIYSPIFMLQKFKIYNQPLSSLPEGKLLITTINAHSYNVSRSDAAFAAALHASHVLLPDGVSVVWAMRWLMPPSSLKGEIRERMKKIAGEDLFYWEMEKLEKMPPSPLKGEKNKSRVFFLGSTEEVLAKIKARAALEFPHVEVHTYSPPYKAVFDAADNKAMIAAINSVQPSALFIGMTAPKQEKWAHEHFAALQVGHVCCIGAVFDFYAGEVSRAPQVFIILGLEWLYRLLSEPRRMWRRYLIGNAKFVWHVAGEWLANGKIKV